MSKIDTIREPIKDHLKAFEPFFREAIASDIKLLDTIVHYIIRHKGKMMRPIMIFLSAGINGAITERTYHAALTIELLHTATLLHDDVVDESEQRRGVPSINALWKNKGAVLVGDYLLGKGLTWCINHKEYDMLNHISVAVEDMSKGELLQMEKARKVDSTREIYFDVIKKKTASLLAASAAVGACSVTENIDIISKMKSIGELAGIAFQIKDDILDLSCSSITGKPSYTDIKERKVTLPLICALEKSPVNDHKRVKKLIRKKKKSSKEIKEIANFISDHNGVIESQKVMDSYISTAIEELRTLPESNYRDSLECYIQYIADRKK